ncbi:hypothetical protein FXN63_15425 [Pigmentiphaga aceris]|uniref:DUF2059 domain-containing protein n=1 Tax=Pigmentiphaga aceris TaxID=1940612 RepID=A0A5C0AZP0_9BURK|nr:hypothetical protein [Pigmentiphaga aceris]QEI07074.1 hypothetical protein FXN63_15425 [Pigmentiphaga aceris]
MIYKRLIISSALALASFSVQAQSLSDYLADSQTLGKKLDIAMKQGGMPRLSDPDAGPLIKRLSDHRQFLDGRTFTQAQLGDLISVCHSANQISVAYALFDLDRRIDRKSQLPEVGHQAAAVMMQNTYTFQEELALIQPFLVRCMSKQLAPLLEMVEAISPEARARDPRMAKLRNMLDGIASNYTSLFEVMHDDRLSPAYKEAMLAALSDVADTVQAAMPVSARQQVLTEMDALDPAAKAPFAKHFDRIDVAMRKTVCEGLCAVR